MKETEINPDLTEIVADLRDKEEDDQADIFLKEARASIEVASQIINSIMTGRQVDIAFFKHLAASKQQRASYLKKYASNYKKRKRRK